MRFSKNFKLLPLVASLAAASLSTQAPAASNSAMATTGFTKTGDGLLWSGWYADPT